MEKNEYKGKNNYKYKTSSDKEEYEYLEKLKNINYDNILRKLHPYPHVFKVDFKRIKDYPLRSAENKNIEKKIIKKRSDEENNNIFINDKSLDINIVNNEKGRYINLGARKRFHQMLYDFFNKYVMIELEKKLTYIDRYITENKKGFKNVIFGFLKQEQPNQSRWNNTFRTYVLSPTEFQEYLIATIFFYFQNYDQAKEICGIFMEDVKKKSIRHYNAAFELQKMCSFMASPSGKETSFEPFDQHINNKDYLPACRALFFGIKASEQKANTAKLPVILTKACKLLSNSCSNNDNQNLSSIVPFILEQTSIYYLIMNPMKKRKFFTTIMQAGAKFCNEGKINAIRYAFNDLLFLYDSML